MLMRVYIYIPLVDHRIGAIGRAIVRSSTTYTQEHQDSDAESSDDDS